MTTRVLIAVYLFFFFMYFFGFGLMGNINAGVPYPWHKQFGPFDITYYSYCVLTVLLAHFVVFRRFYYARPRWKLWIALLALLLFYILFRYLLEEIVLAAILGHGNYNPVTTFRFYVIDNIYFGSVILFLGFVLFLFDEMFRNRKRQADLKEKNREAELNFLEAQMNPHFLYNSLNNIYSLALEQHPQTANAVLKLSDIMRYVTYRKEKTVLFSDELNYVSDLLAIEQLRHDHPLQTTLTIQPEVLLCRLPPLLLVPLVENALKHSDLSDLQLPLRLSAKLQAQQLVLCVSNKKADYKKPETGGVGLENLRRRLELLYHSQQYVFKQEVHGNIFTITLQIPVA